MNPKSAARVARDYCDDVISGKIRTCKYMTLACERHLRDLDTAGDRGFYFSERAAQHVVDFFAKFLRHSKGEWARQPFVLEPWQVFVLSVEFGWLRIEDGLRRYRIGWNELPRKNGKSTLSAGKGLYLFLADNEPGAEVYTAATKREQAKIIWSEAARMVKASPPLAQLVRIYHSSLSIAQVAAKFEPIGADSNTLDGLNVHGGLIDEIHAHRSRGVYDLLETGTSSRRQSLIDITTTAGSDRHSIAYELHDYAAKILDGILDDDTFFAVISSANSEDDWRLESTWKKANPNLGISVKISDLAAKAKRAADIPGYENTFKRLHLNVWTEQATRWLNMEKWDACAGQIDLNALTGSTCWAGLDLSSTTDITAFVLVFNVQDRTVTLPFFFVPEENAVERAKLDRVPYDRWIRDGYIHATPGNVIDYDFIRAFINEKAEQYDIREIALDRWNGTQLGIQLTGDGRNIVPFGQGFASMSFPSKELEALVRGQKLVHGGNPVLRWMASNVSIKADAAGNIKPVKDESTGRIDGIVGLVMGIGSRSLAPADQPFVYNSMGVYIG